MENLKLDFKGVKTYYKEYKFATMSKLDIKQIIK